LFGWSLYVTRLFLPEEMTDGQLILKQVTDATPGDVKVCIKAVFLSKGRERYSTLSLVIER
jgi:hypothetical protein